MYWKLATNHLRTILTLPFFLLDLTTAMVIRITIIASRSMVAADPTTAPTTAVTSVNGRLSANETGKEI